MIRKLMLVSLLALGLVVAGAAPAAAADASDVRGGWVSVDVVDGSDQVMFVVGGGDRFTVVLVDESATVCDGAAALVTGRATLSGGVLSASLRVLCRNGAPLGPFDLDFTFDAGPPATLTDSTGTSWSRG